LDSGGFGSNVVRAGQCLVKAIEKWGLQGGKGDNKEVAWARHLHDPGIQQEPLGDDNIVTATDFGHPEGRRYAVAVQEILALPDVALERKKKMMWDNALRLYPICP